MKKVSCLVFALAILGLGCGSPQKHTKAQHSKKGSVAENPITDTEDNQTLEDIIYSSLGHKKGSGVSYRKEVQEGGKFDIPMTYNERVQKWIDYFTGRGRGHFERYLSRSGRFIPYMHTVLKQYHVPNDLVYLSMIESGFNTRANSWASAVGPWQFIKSTGAMYGLNSDYFIDDRRDVEKSTHAAAQHLRDLHNEFGDWYLAFAAYNAGAGKVRNAIRRHGTNFWDMAEGSYLRQETKDYVPKILAAATVAKNPSKYGFRNIEYQIPIDYERVKMSSATDLEVAAACAGVDPNLIRLLNSELLRDMTPPQITGYMLKIPRGTKSNFVKRYAALSPAERLRSTEYMVEKGDSLREIANRFDTSENEIAKANPDDVQVSHHKQTKKAKVYGRRGKYKIKKQTFTVASYHVSPGDRLMIPKNRSVAKADSLSDDAAAHAAKGRFGIQVAELEKQRPEESIKGKKGKKKQKEEKLIAVADTPTPEPTDLIEAPEKSIPVRSDLTDDLYESEAKQELEVAKSDLDSAPIRSEKSDLAAGTPLGFQGKPDDVVAINEVPSSPTDQQLKNAVQGLHVKTDDLAVEDTKAETPVVKKQVPKKVAAPSSHKVKKGETLGTVASRYGVSVKDLKTWNQPKLRNGLMAGTTLAVKSNSPAVVKYKVKPGDNLATIAQQHATTTKELQKLNGLKSPKILPGAILIVRNGK